MASSGGVNPRARAEAQRADEMFEVMRPPPSDGFDVDRDRPTPTGERKARGLVHADGDWHRSAHVWLVDARRGRLAMQRRSAKKDTFPNRWDISAAGHVSVDDDGDSRKTAVNELAEELGVELDDPRELEFQFTCPAEMAPLGGCNCFEDVYFLPWNVDSNGDAFAVGEAEVTATKWIDIDDLRRALEDDDGSYVPRTATYRARHHVNPLAVPYALFNSHAFIHSFMHAQPLSLALARIERDPIPRSLSFPALVFQKHKILSRRQIASSSSPW